MKRAIIIFLLILIGLGIGISVGVSYQKTKVSKRDRLEKDKMALAGILPGRSDEEAAELLGMDIEEGKVDIGIATEATFEQNGKKGRLGIENIETNHYSFRVDLKLDKTGESIYQSGLIDPGFHIEFVELNKALPAGDYRATAVVSTYLPEKSEKRISEFKVKILLHITDGS